MSQNTSEPGAVIQTDSISKKAFLAGLWVALSSGSTGFLSLIQTIVVARLLYPADLGLMGMASLALWTLHVFTQPGIEAALIYRKELDDEAASTAWTISVCRGLALFGLLWAGAPWVAVFFREPRLTALIRGLAGVSLVDGLANIWVVSFQKELNFKRQAAFEQLTQVASVATTLVAVAVLRDVWALVIGRLAGALVRTISSYFFAARHPTWKLNREVARQLLAYGRHIMGINILAFFLTQGDDAFVGRVLGTAALGFYGLAYRLSNLPRGVISQILLRITFPLYSKLREDRSQMELVYRRIVEINSLLAVPFTGALMVLAPEIVQVVYGARWLPAVPALRILCVFGLIRALNVAIGSLLQAIGLPNRVEKICAIQLLLMAITIYPMGRGFGIAGVSACVTLANGLGLAMLLRDIRRDAGFPVRIWLVAQRTPFWGTCAAAAIVYAVSQALPGESTVTRVIALGLLGSAVYVGCIFQDRSAVSQLRAVVGYACERLPLFRGKWKI